MVLLPVPPALPVIPLLLVVVPALVRKRTAAVPAVVVPGFMEMGQRVLHVRPVGRIPMPVLP